MVDTVDTVELISDGRVHYARFTNESDGTGESNVVKVDMSELTTSPSHNKTLIAVDVMRCFGQVGGFNYVTLRYDATTDDEIVVLPPGSFDHDWNDVRRGTGGLRNPLSAGVTGDIMFTTDGAIDGASYSVTLECHLRYRA